MPYRHGACAVRRRRTRLTASPGCRSPPVPAIRRPRSRAARPPPCAGRRRAACTFRRAFGQRTARNAAFLSARTTNRCETFAHRGPPRRPPCAGTGHRGTSPAWCIRPTPQPQVRRTGGATSVPNPVGRRDRSHDSATLGPARTRRRVRGQAHRPRAPARHRRRPSARSTSRRRCPCWWTATWCSPRVPPS